MISYFNYEINHNLNEKNRIIKLNNKINENVNIEKTLPVYINGNKVTTINKKFNTIYSQQDSVTNEKDIVEPYILQFTKLAIKKNYIINNNFNINWNNKDNSYIDTSFIINIVYQYKYRYNKSVTGFGDLIRGIYFILQFSEKYNIKYDFNINNHIIKKYLFYFCDKSNISEEISKNIPFFDTENYEYISKNNIIEYKYFDIDNIILKFLLNINNCDNNKYIYLINHPDQKCITDKHREIVQDIIKPTDYIYNLIDICLNNLRLVKYKFITIHIRTFDSCFSNDKSLDINKNIVIILNFIQKTYIQHKLDIFILSSDNNIKLNIIKHFKHVKVLIHNITHTCIDNNDEEGIVNTLKDFYIMSYSKYIYSFSVYEHGSGFSKWCATTYNIPYICYSLKK